MRQGRATLIESCGVFAVITWLEYYSPAGISRLILDIELIAYD